MVVGEKARIILIYVDLSKSKLFLLHENDINMVLKLCFSQKKVPIVTCDIPIYFDPLRVPLQYLPLINIGFGGMDIDLLKLKIPQAGDTTTRYDEAMNVKLLLREICQFLEPGRDNAPSNYSETGRDQLKSIASKVLFALSVNNFNAVFSRISG